MYLIFDKSSFPVAVACSKNLEVCGINAVKNETCVNIIDETPLNFNGWEKVNEIDGAFHLSFIHNGERYYLQFINDLSRYGKVIADTSYHPNLNKFMIVNNKIVMYGSEEYSLCVLNGHLTCSNEFSSDSSLQEECDFNEILPKMFLYFNKLGKIISSNSLLEILPINIVKANGISHLFNKWEKTDEIDGRFNISYEENGERYYLNNSGSMDYVWTTNIKPKFSKFMSVDNKIVHINNDMTTPSNFTLNIENGKYLSDLNIESIKNTESCFVVLTNDV